MRWWGVTNGEGRIDGGRGFILRGHITKGWGGGHTSTRLARKEVGAPAVSARELPVLEKRAPPLVWGGEGEGGGGR